MHKITSRLAGLFVLLFVTTVLALLNQVTVLAQQSLGSRNPGPAPKPHSGASSGRAGSAPQATNPLSRLRKLLGLGSGRKTTSPAPHESRQEVGFQFLSLVMAATLGFLLGPVAEFLLRGENYSPQFWREAVLVIALLLYIEAYFVFATYHRRLGLTYGFYFIPDLTAAVLFVRLVQVVVSDAPVTEVVLIAGLGNFVTCIRQFFSLWRAYYVGILPNGDIVDMFVLAFAILAQAGAVFICVLMYIFHEQAGIIIWAIGVVWLAVYYCIAHVPLVRAFFRGTIRGLFA